MESFLYCLGSSSLYLKKNNALKEELTLFTFMIRQEHITDISSLFKHNMKKT